MTKRVPVLLCLFVGALAEAAWAQPGHRGPVRATFDPGAVEAARTAPALVAIDFAWLAAPVPSAPRRLPVLVRTRGRDAVRGQGSFTPAPMPKPRCTALKGILVGATIGGGVGLVGGLLKEPHDASRAGNILADVAVGTVAGGIVGWLVCHA